MPIKTICSTKWQSGYWKMNILRSNIKQKSRSFLKYSIWSHWDFPRKKPRPRCTKNEIFPNRFVQLLKFFVQLLQIFNESLVCFNERRTGHGNTYQKSWEWNQSFTLLNWLIKILEYTSWAPSSFLFDKFLQKAVALRKGLECVQALYLDRWFIFPHALWKCKILRRYEQDFLQIGDFKLFCQNKTHSATHWNNCLNISLILRQKVQLRKFNSCMGWYTYESSGGGGGGLRQKWDVIGRRRGRLASVLAVQYFFLLRKIEFAPWGDIMLSVTYYLQEIFL